MRSLHILAGLLLAATIAAPVSAATAGGATEESLTGLLEMAQVDNFGNSVDSLVYSLRNGSRITPVEFASGNPAGLVGDTVTLTGTRSHGALRVPSTRAGRDLTIRSQAKGTGTGTWAAETVNGSTISGGATTAADTTGASVSAKSIAVVMFNFTDNRTTPYTKTNVMDALVNSNASLRAYFEEESKGRMTVTGSVFGWYQLNTSTAGCPWQTWHTLAWNAATAAGVNLSAFTNVMFIWPGTSQCGFAGMGYVPGQYSYVNGTLNVQVLTHEVGHNLGLSHSNALRCTSNGTKVMIAAPADCTTETYADPFSTMGNNALRHNHGSHLGELGWLTGAEKVVGAPGNSYTIAPYFGPDGVKLVRIPRGDGTYFDLDVRTPYGVFDDFMAGSPAVAGVTIRIGEGTASPTSSPKQTLLLDSTPGTTDLKDAPLLVGKTMTDPRSSISITALAVGASGITVRIREGIAPSAPASVNGSGTVAPSAGITWSAATDNVAIGTYKVSRDGSLLATIAGSTTSYTDGTAQLGASYTYAVTAVDTSGNTGPAASVAVTMPTDPNPSPTPDPTPAPTASPDPSPSPDPTVGAADAVAPVAPTGLVGTATVTTATLSWIASTDNIAVAGYGVTRNGTLVATTAGLSWKDTGRSPLTSYAYTVVALDAVGNVSGAATVSVRTLADTIRPTTPRNFHRVARSGSYVTFDWSPSTDNVSVAKYYVYRVGRSTPVAVARISRIRIYTVRGAYYYVRAVDTSRNRSYASAKVRGRR